jgi:hypothetical protein
VVAGSVDSLVSYTDFVVGLESRAGASPARLAEEQGVRGEGAGAATEIPRPPVSHMWIYPNSMSKISITRMVPSPPLG